MWAIAPRVAQPPQPPLCYTGSHGDVGGTPHRRQVRQCERRRNEGKRGPWGLRATHPRA